jgi:hypothetical protein
MLNIIWGCVLNMDKELIKIFIKLHNGLKSPQIKDMLKLNTVLPYAINTVKALKLIINMLRNCINKLLIKIILTHSVILDFSINKVGVELDSITQKLLIGIKNQQIKDMLYLNFI